MSNNIRISKDEYYLNIARAVSLRGTCLRRNFGAVIVKDDRIVSTGYTESPRGEVNCIDIGICPRNEAGCKPGHGYELCKSVHAEQNSIIQASPADMNGSTIYVACSTDIGWLRPCKTCRSMIINAGIKEVVCPNDYGKPTTVYTSGVGWFTKNGKIMLDFMQKDENGCGY